MSEPQKPDSEIIRRRENTYKYLTFVLSGETYAISILRVREIIEYEAVTPMPMMPEFITGAINLRGAVVPIINLAERLGLKSASISPRTCNIIVELQTEEKMINVGLTVDSVSKVIDLKPEQIKHTPTLGGQIRIDFIEGMGEINQHFFIILNVDKILSMEELATFSETRPVDDMTH